MFVIFGASGKVGSVTAANLRKAGHRVRAVVRNGTQAQRFAALGCETVMADLADRRSVREAIKGADAVQMLCPLPARDSDPETTMRTLIDVAADALLAAPPRAVLALSDYGAELREGTGLTLIYHYLETRLKAIATHLTLVRSAEHMQNWAHQLPMMLDKGFLVSLHDPLNKPFPTVAAQDVGAIAAELLLDRITSKSPRIVSVEGPQRITVTEVARVLSEISQRNIPAVEFPRHQWSVALLQAGMSERRVKLVTDLYDAHNAGLIDVDANATERRFGTTTLMEVFASLLPAFGRDHTPA